MKRIISFVLSLAITVSLFSGIDISALATTTEQENSNIQLIDIDVYKAQCFAGIAYDPDTEAVEDCNAIYNYYIDEGVYSPTKSFLDVVYADDELMAEFALWQLESLGVDPSSIVDTPIQKKDYYESLITAIIAHEYAEDSPKTQDLAVQATGYYATIVDSLCNITDSADTVELLDNLDVNSPDTMKVLEQMFDENPELGGFDVIDIILSASNTIMDAIEKIAAYSTMHSLDWETKAWLESMYNACDENTDAALKAALFNLMNASYSFTQAVLVDIKDTSFRLENWGVGATVNVGLSMLAATNPLTTAIMAGLKLGKTICDICFATSDICEQLFLLECMYDIQSLARTVSEEARINFVNSQTKENAKAFTYAVHYYFESIINTDIDCMISFLDLLYNGGLLKGALTWVYGATDDYQEAVDSLESLREVRQNNYNLMINLYKAALAINYKDTFDYHYTADNTVPITGIRFRETWLLPMEVGDFSNIYVQYEPSNTTQKAYTVTSDNPAVVEVHDNVITAVGEGTANITIRSVENPQVSYTADIMVDAKSENTGAEEPKPVAPSSKFRYTVDNGEATITGLVEGYEPSYLTIPSYVDGYSVVGIGTSAFCNRRNLKRVMIPDGITYIGVYAFQDCAGLTNVVIPDSVTSIYNSAFKGCTGLTSVMVPDSVTYIGGSAFEGCTGLTSITIPNGITSIEGRTFSGCRCLASVNIPESVTNIGNWAFNDCSNLTSVTISNGVNSIGEAAFRNCTSLTSMTLPDSVNTIGGYAFYGCSSLTNVTISDSVTSIGTSAFEGCSSLANITIRKGGTSVGVSDGGTGIGERAFYGCGSLTSITIPDGATSIDKLAFYGCSNLASVTIPKSVTNIGDRAFNDCSNLTNVTIRDGVTNVMAIDGVNSIGERAFSGCSRLTNMTVPDGVTSIGNYAFAGCSSLTSVIIPKSVTNIGDYAFRSCSSLTNVTIRDGVTNVTVPESTTEIGNYAFEDCSSLVSITIPDGVISIGYWAFVNCSSLVSVTIPEGVTSIDKYAFYGCSSLTSVTLPESVTSIGINVFTGCDSLNSVYISNLSAWCNNFNNFDSNPLHYGSDLYINGELVTELIIPDGITTLVPAVFRNCTSITSVIIPQGVTSIEGWALSGCSNLTSVTISKGVNSIGESAFADCTSLTSIAISDSVNSIGESAFANCTSLTSITIPNSVTSIGSALFSRCSSLTSVIIPEGITSIEDWLFYSCSSLSSVTIPDSVTNIGELSFHNCTSLTSITIPDSVITIEYEAFASCSDLVEIFFEGDAPNIEASAFDGVRATAYYPADNATWNEEVMQQYDGTITWIAYNPNHKHEYATVATPPTCTEMGFTTYTCNCGDSYVGDYVNALGHDYVESICTRCGEEDPSYQKTTAGTDFNSATQVEINTTYTNSTPNPWPYNYYYSFTTSEQGVLYIDFSTTNFTEESTFYLSVYDSDYAEIFRTTSTASTPITTHGLGLSSGLYYIEISPSRLDDYHSFTLTYLSSANWETERNNTFDTADHIIHDQEIYGHLGGSVDDDDYFVFEVNEPGLLDARFYGNLDVRFYNAQQEFLLRESLFEMSPDESSGAIQIGLAPGIYYLNFNVNSTGFYDYRFILNWTAHSKWEAEQNDNIDSATPYTPGDLVSGNLMDMADVDWYSFTIDETCIISLDFTLPEGTSSWPVWYVSLLDSDQFEWMNSVHESYDDNQVRMELQPGDYYLKVYTIDNHHSSANYSLRLSIIHELVNPFSDVTPGSFFYEPVMWAVENGITNGTSATTFGPKDQCMRAQVVTFLWRAVGSPEPTKWNNPFVDVKPSDYYYKPVLWAVENGITSGMDTTHFGPTSYCNRAQVVTFLYRTMGNPDFGAATNPFTDVAVGSFYEKPVLWAVENGVTAGMSATSFGPNSICNRAQIVTFLYRAFVD